MNCLVYEGSGVCVWCRNERDAHPYRWCRRCGGDRTTPDPTDREAQLEGRPSWAWRQNPCACRHGIVTIVGQKLNADDEARLEQARQVDRTPVRRYLPFHETEL